MVALGSNNTTEDDSTNNFEVSEVCLNDTKFQYVDLIFYLKNGYAPVELDFKKKRALRLSSNQYQLVNDVFLGKFVNLPHLDA